MIADSCKDVLAAFALFRRILPRQLEAGLQFVDLGKRFMSPISVNLRFLQSAHAKSRERSPDLAMESRSALYSSVQVIRDVR